MTREPEPRGVRLLVAYDGERFAGWQAQPGQRTVAGTLAEAIARMNGTRPAVRGASRTDAGVHAEGQVAAFDPARLITPHGWMKGLNSSLPEDVSVRAADECARGYDPRHDAAEKRYRYLLQVGVARDPLMRGRAWYLHPGLFPRRQDRGSTGRDWLDLEAMREAAGLLEGEHDFRAFRASNDGRERTVRSLREVRVVEEASGRSELVAIDVRGNAFLKNMVRIVAGTLVDVGRSRMPVSMVAAALGPGGERTMAGETAPAHGLTLVHITLGRATRER